MSQLLHRAIALGLSGSLLAALAFAASAATSPSGDPRLGEQLFFEHSFGATAASVPLKIFEALPDRFPEFAPSELEQRFGLLYRPGRSLPVGMVSASALGIDRLSFNCSLCHTGRIDGKLVPGLPNVNLRVQEFEEAMVSTLASPGLTADTLMPAIKLRHPDLSWAEEAQLRLWLAAAKWQAPRRQPSPHRAGPGRFDLLGSFKTRLGLPPHHFNAQMDIPALFGSRMLKRYPRDGALGGDQDLVRYLIVRLSGENTPLKDGKPPAWVKDLNGYLARLDPPPYPGPIDRPLATRGHQLFLNTCSPCHGTYEPGHYTHPNRLIPIAVVGTDANRIAVWDADAIAYTRRDPIMKQLDMQPGVGFLPPSLRGVWATAPYLHNGSVPTVHDVLSDPASRPKTFYRGGEHLDPVKLGLSTIDAPADGHQYRFDTGIPGNTNTGHPFGMPLSEPERMAVIEYLKTL